jgi:hypothetical protein
MLYMQLSNSTRMDTDRQKDIEFYALTTHYTIYSGSCGDLSAAIS